MKTSTLVTLWQKRGEMNLIQFGLKLILIALFSINYANVFAQQKVVNQQELQQQLIEVNGDIQTINQTIAAVNARIAGIPPESLDPSIQVRLNDLQIQKNQYARRKVSIEALLNTPQDSMTPGYND